MFLFKKDTLLLKEYCIILKRLNDGRRDWSKTGHCPSSVYFDDTALHRCYERLNPFLQKLVCEHPAFYIVNPNTGSYYTNV